MPMRFVFTFLSVTLLNQVMFSQNNVVSGYQVQQLTVPSALQNQVCISGMVYNKGKLLLISERCPQLFEIDTVPGPAAKTIQTTVAGIFETEGIAVYGDNVLMVSENLPTVYRINSAGVLSTISTSPALPGKLKSGDGMEGIAVNEKDKLVYLLRERSETGSYAQIFTYKINEAGDSFSLTQITNTELPLESKDWRYADICFDKERSQLLCLKSFSGGKTRKHKIDALQIENEGRIRNGSLQTVVAEGFSNISTGNNKKEKNSLNFEGLAIDESGNMYVVSDNTSGPANCQQPSKEKTVLLKLSKTK